MTCREVNESLAGFAGGKLSAREAQAVEAHLAACRACARELALVKKTLSLASRVAQPSIDLDADLFDRIRLQAAPAAPAVARPGLRRRTVRGLNLKTITAGSIIFVLFAGLFLFLPHSAEQAAGNPGQALWSSGDVETQGPGGSLGPLESGQRLATGTRLKTGPHGLARVRLGNRAEAGLYPDAEVVLHPTAPRLLTGRCFFRVEKGRAPFRVLTRLGTVEVTGTSFFVTVEPGQVGVDVVSGTVRLVSANEAVALRPGTSAIARPGRAGPDLLVVREIPAAPAFMADQPLLLTAAPNPAEPASRRPAFSLDRPFTLAVTNVSDSVRTIHPFHPAYPRFMLEVTAPGPDGREAFVVNLNPFGTGPGAGAAGPVRLKPGQAYRVAFDLRGAVRRGLLKAGEAYRARAVYQAARRGRSTWTGRIKSPSFSFTPGD